MDAKHAGASRATDTRDREIVITRVFDAPRELVWKTWTDPKHIVNWWGPKGFTSTIHEMDVRTGGAWRLTMHGPDGTDYPNDSVFIEVVKPERIVYAHGGGRAGDPPALFEATWTFKAQGEKTELTMRMLFASAEARQQVVEKYRAVEGANQTFGRLADYLAVTSGTVTNGKAMPREREIVLTRIFNAPREMVFKAWTDPKQLARWWGPKGFTNPVCEADARVGGAWHIVMRSPAGDEHPCGGVYQEVVEPERLVFTNVATDKDGNPIIDGLTTVLFTDEGGKTKVTLRTRGLAVVDYAVPYLAGMEMGWTQSLERLAEQLAG
jgi:uncharacterized protein YndB with AHSA1/START domain